jgi:hypothetical protein
MRRLAIAAALLAASPALASPCVREQVSNVDFGQVRGRPGLSEARLWQMPANSVVVWCRVGEVDERGIDWHWIYFRSDAEPWEHQGWVSSRILEDLPPVVAMPAAPAPRTVTTTTTTVTTIVE